MRLGLWQNLFAYFYALPAHKLVLQAVTVSRIATTCGAVVFLCTVAQRQGCTYVPRFFEVANPELYTLT